MTRPLTLLALLLLSGCALRQPPSLESYDVLSGPENAAQVKELASALSERISIRYPQELVYVDEPRGRGMFGDALRYALGRNNALAMRPDLAGVSLVYALGELAPGQGYLNLRFSDGTAMAQSFTLDRMPLSPTPAVVETILEAPASEDAEDATETAAYPLPAPSGARQANDETPNRKGGTQEAEDLATGHQNMPLRMAVLAHLPYGWRYTIPDASKREIRVSWPEGSGWRERIKFAADQAGCRAEFDDFARRVTVRTIPVSEERKPLIPVASVSPGLPGATLPASVPPVSMAPEAILPASPEPSIGSTLSPAASALATFQKAPSTTEWELKPGSLEAQLGDWCATAGWQLLWKSEHDIQLQAHAIMRGDFETAVTSVLQSLHAQGNSLRATLYKANSVLEIKDN